MKPAARLRMRETVAAEQLSPVCELKEALREIRPEKPDMDLEGMVFPAGEIDITDTAKSPASWTGGPRRKRRSAYS